MSNEQMDQHWREDSALEGDCREAARLLGRILEAPRFQNHKKREVLMEAYQTCFNTAAHIVAVWD